jgi:hypothetical protein
MALWIIESKNIGSDNDKLFAPHQTASLDSPSSCTRVLPGFGGGVRVRNGMILSTEAGVKQDADRAVTHPCCSVERLRDLNLLVDQIIARIAYRRGAAFRLFDILPRTSRQDGSDGSDTRYRGVAVRSEVLRLFGILCIAIVFAWMLVIIRHSLGAERIGEMGSFHRLQAHNHSNLCGQPPEQAAEQMVGYYGGIVPAGLPWPSEGNQVQCPSLPVAFGSAASLIRDMPARR